MKVKDSRDNQPLGGVVVKQRTYESVIDELGGFGHWQRCIFFFICIPDIFNTFVQMVLVFTGANPGATCVDTTKNNTWILNFTELASNASSSMETVPGSALSGEDLCACSKVEFNTAFTSIVTEWRLICGLNHVSDVISSIQFTGMLVGATTVGQISDSFGRKRVHFTAVALMGLGGFTSGLAPNWQTYSCMRFITGLGSGGFAALNSVYPLEFVGRKWRTLTGTIGFWAVSQMILSLLGYYTRNWRHLTMITTGITILYIPFWWLIPESPRWLAQKGRITEAEEVIRLIARRNKVPVPDLSAFREGTILNEKDGYKVEGRTSQRRKRRFTYLDLVRTKQMAVITIAVMILWLASYITYYFLSLNLKNLAGNRYINLLIGGIMDQVISIVVVFVNNYLGRRQGFISFAMGSMVFTLSLVFILLFHHGGVESSLFTYVALVAKGICAGACYVVQVFTAEVYPTCIRNSGVAAGQLMARIGVLLAPQVVYLATLSTIAPYLLIAVVTLVALPPCFLLPETKDQPLQDTMEIVCRHDNALPLQDTMEIVRRHDNADT